MATEYTTTHNHTALWWTLGAIAVLLILWLVFRGMGASNPSIPNTGVDDTASSTDLLNSSAASTTGPTTSSTTNLMQAKG